MAKLTVSSEYELRVSVSKYGLKQFPQQRSDPECFLVAYILLKVKLHLHF